MARNFFWETRWRLGQDCWTNDAQLCRKRPFSFVPPAPWEWGELRSKEKGKKSVYFNGSEETIELILRAIVSVNQLSKYGAVADLCEGLSKDSEVFGKFAANEDLESKEIPTELPAVDPHTNAEFFLHGNLLQDCEHKFAWRPEIVQIVFRNRFEGCWRRTVLRYTWCHFSAKPSLMQSRLLWFAWTYRNTQCSQQRAGCKKPEHNRRTKCEDTLQGRNTSKFQWILPFSKTITFFRPCLRCHPSGNCHWDRPGAATAREATRCGNGCVRLSHALCWNGSPPTEFHWCCWYAGWQMIRRLGKDGKRSASQKTCSHAVRRMPQAVLPPNWRLSPLNCKMLRNETGMWRWWWNLQDWVK